jgi:hypothetical protein
MTIELKMLALCVVLGLVQIVLAAHAASLQRGYMWTASSRDAPMAPLTGVAGRPKGRCKITSRDVPAVCAAVSSPTSRAPRMDDGMGRSLLGAASPILRSMLAASF